jgi:CheY-like chemotaxis protein/signal transduction histidine kinase
MMSLILVVDDKEENVYLLRSLLLGHGYRVQCAKNGAEALERAGRETPDLVISDILMPVMDGFTLCRRWKQDATLRDVPFVFYTATYTEPKDEELALSLGAERFLVKPVEPDRFLEMIASLLEEHRQGQLSVRQSTPPAETQYLREYNAVLINKLEDKVLQLENKNRTLVEKDAFNKAVLDSTAALVAVVGPGGDVVMINQAWARLSPDERAPELLRLRVGANVLAELGRAQVEPGSVTGRVKEGLRDVLESSRPDCEVELPDGPELDPRWYLVRIVRVGTAGIGAVIACIDITGRKRGEQALEETARRKDEFLALLGHELRNPLAPIKLASQLLLGLDLTDPRAERASKTIDRQVTHLARMIDDLLDLSRIARGKLILETKPIDWSEAVRTATEDWRASFESHGIELHLELPLKHIWVSGDATRLTQVLGNLLNNAQKFTSRGGRVDVHLEVDEQENWTRLLVRDTGVGMTAETLGRVFEPFEQAPQSSARTRGGMGVGLALVNGLVRLHGGEVRATSPGPGLGSEIFLRLPMKTPPTERSRQPSGGRPGGSRILVIEDNHDTAETLQTFLETQGSTVDVAYDGPSGLRIAHERAPEVVLCDIGLPGAMDGYDVARAVRADSTLSSTRLIALTGYGQAGDQRRAIEAGFDAHVTKPPDPERLLSLVSRSERVSHG